MESSDLAPHGDATKRHVPIRLTDEEMKVIKECSQKSIFYRGIPLGIIFAGVARIGIQAGVFIPKYSRVLYGGMVCFGFLCGVESHPRRLMEKILVLENSYIAEDLRELKNKEKDSEGNPELRLRYKIAQNELLLQIMYQSMSQQKEARRQGRYTKEIKGPILDEKAEISRDFQDDYVDMNVPVDESFESPLNKRLQGGNSNNTWDKIRNQSRQAQPSTLNEKGISYQELNKRLTPEEEDNIKRKNKHILSESSPLDLSTSSESSMDDSNINTESESESELKKKRTYGRDIPHKNKYGDDIM